MGHGSWRMLVALRGLGESFPRKVLKYTTQHCYLVHVIDDEIIINAFNTIIFKLLRNKLWILLTTHIYIFGFV